VFFAYLVNPDVSELVFIEISFFQFFVFASTVKNLSTRGGY